MNGYTRNLITILIITWTFLLETNLSVHYSNRVIYWGDHYVSLGQPFTINCQMSVFDPFMWTKNGIPLPAQSKHNPIFNYTELIKTNINERILTLRVWESDLNSTGYYRCNRFDRSSHSLKIITDSLYPNRNNSNATYSSQVLNVGEKNRIRCPIDNPLTLKWYKNGQEVLETSNITFKGKELIIANGQPVDAGEYMCNIATIQDSLHAHLIHIHYRAVVKQFPLRTVATRNENFTLECVVHGFPIPKITWFVGNVKVSLLHRSQIRLIIRKHPLAELLYINEAELSDTNLYTCQATNALGSDETSTFLFVKESSIETNANKFSRELSMKLGKPLVLMCQTHENSTWSVEWYKDGDRKISANDTRVTFLDYNSTLVIQSSVEDDAGEYICCAHVGTTQRNSRVMCATIFVIARKLISSGEDSDGVVILNLELPLEISCTSTTGQDWEVIWLKNNLLLKESDRIEFNYSSNSLVIMKPEEEDAADYMCVVKADKVNILVNATIFVRTLPKIKSFPFSESIYEGDLFVLHCLILSGSHDIKITWFKDDEELLLYDRHYLILADEKYRHAKLVIEEIQWSDRANYKCLVENDYGKAESTVLVRIKDRFAALWPFIGICVQMGILYIIITIHGKMARSASGNLKRRHKPKRSSSQSKANP